MLAIDDVGDDVIRMTTLTNLIRGGSDGRDVVDRSSVDILRRSYAGARVCPGSLLLGSGIELSLEFTEQYSKRGVKVIRFSGVFCLRQERCAAICASKHRPEPAR